MGENAILIGLGGWVRMQFNAIQLLAAREVPWVPEVFSRAQRDHYSAEGRTTSGEGRTTSGEAARKTSGPERYDLPFPLNFDRFYRI